MWTLWLLLGLVVVSFSFVLLYGAPYLPTLRPQIIAALDLLDLNDGQTMLELGCGDGRVLRAAAARGWNCVGYELNPILAGIAWLRTRRYRKQVQIIWGDYWKKSWPEFAGVFAFILPKYMAKLDKKITQETGKPVKLVSFAFKITARKPTQQRDGVLLYEYK